MATAPPRPSSDSLVHFIDESQLRPGDHIYAWRALGTYSHHGLYTGKQNRQVIHFTGDGSLYKNKSAARIRASTLQEFADGSYIHLAVYGHKEGFWYKVKRSGTCYSEESDPPATVLERAEAYLDDPNKRWGDYNVFFNNCESFVVYCKTGKKYSQQGILARTVATATTVFASVFGITYSCN